MSSSEEGIDRFAARYPPAEMAPAEFETFVSSLLGAVAGKIEDLRVTGHEVIEGVDGSYDFDATMRYRLAGMEFLVVVEAKRHSNPIKREHVQVLHSKAIGVGAHKAILFATARFQRGAIEFAKTHGVALVLVTEGRFTYETRAAERGPVLSREDALRELGIPVFVGVHIGLGDRPDSTMLSVIGADDPDRVAEVLLPAAPD